MCLCLFRKISKSFDRCRVGVTDFIISERNAIALRVAASPVLARYCLTAYDFTSTFKNPSFTCHRCRSVSNFFWRRAKPQRTNLHDVLSRIETLIAGLVRHSYRVIIINNARTQRIDKVRYWLLCFNVCV
jgi:hypothetical protein